MSNLRFSHGEEFRRGDIASITLHAVASRRKVVGVNSKKEGSTGHKLHVVPPLAVDQTTGSVSYTHLTLPTKRIV